MTAEGTCPGCGADAEEGCLVVCTEQRYRSASSSAELLDAAGLDELDEDELQPPALDAATDDAIEAELREVAGDEAADRFRRIVEGGTPVPALGPPGMTVDDLAARMSRGDELDEQHVIVNAHDAAAAVAAWVADELGLDADTIAVVVGTDNRAHVTIEALPLVGLVVPAPVAQRVGRHGSPMLPWPARVASTCSDGTAWGRPSRSPRARTA